MATAVKNRRGISGLRSLHYRASASSDIEIVVEAIAADGSSWRYLLAFNKGDKKQGLVPVVTKEAVWKKMPTDAVWAQLVERPSTQDKHDPKLLTQTWLQQVTQNQSFRELAEFFASVSYLQLIPQLIRQEQRPAEESLGADAYGRDLLSRIRATSGKTKEARLERIRKILATAVPNLTELELVPDVNNNPHLQARFKHWRGPAAKQDEREFSDGTLRLIGLLWALPNEILLVRSASEGSVVIHGADIAGIREALEGGLTVADVVMPMTAKEQIDLLSRMDA